MNINLQITVYLKEEFKDQAGIWPPVALVINPSY